MIGMTMVSGYLFRKVPENPFAIRAFEPLWGKRKAPAFVSKSWCLLWRRRRDLVLLARRSSVRPALRPHCGLIHPRSVQIPSRPISLHNKRDSDFSKSLSWRRRRDLVLLARRSSVRPALRPHCGLIHPRSVQIPSRPISLHNKRDSDFSKSLSWRRRRDLNPRAAYRSLLP